MTDEEEFDTLEPIETTQASFNYIKQENPMDEARKYRSGCVEKTPECWIFSVLAYVLVSVARMLAELTAGGLEIEQHIVLL